MARLARSLLEDAVVAACVGGFLAVVFHRLVDSPAITMTVVIVMAALAVWIIKRRQNGTASTRT